MIYNFYSDPAHGWLKVPLSKIFELNILDQITGFSYLSPNHDHVFLEEDLDVSIFLNSLSKKEREKFKVRQFYTNRESKIRSYVGYDLSKLLKEVLK